MKTAFDVYEEWNLVLPELPLHSVLYSFRPTGVGTPQVESLTSYIVRLAKDHCVFPGMLLEQILGPAITKRLPTRNSRSYFRSDGGKSTLMNGTSPRAINAVKVFEDLTLRSDLRHLTLLSLTSVLPARGLVRLTKAWCPLCYEEWRASGQAVYEPLLWFLLPVSMCECHRVRLQEVCPYSDCQRSSPGIGWRSVVGYCPYCFRWLGKEAMEKERSPGEGFDETELTWQFWVTQNLGDLLARVSAMTVPLEREQALERIASMVRQSNPGGNVSTPLARRLNVSISMVQHWKDGRCVPELDKLLLLCYALGCSPSEALLDGAREVSACQNIPTNPALRRRRSPSPLIGEHVRHALEAALEEFPPPSVTEVAQRVGHTLSDLYKYHPLLCRAVSTRYRAYRQQVKEETMQKHSEEIRSLARRLAAEGTPLTPKWMSPFLSQPGIMRNPVLRQIVREVRLEVENQMKL